MELKDFFDLVRTEIQESIADKLRLGREYPYAEVEFVERFVAHMVESGMTFPNSSICTHQGKVGRATIKISGYSFSYFEEEVKQIDLFVANYKGNEELEEISRPELLIAAKHCFQFLAESANGRLSELLEKSSDVYGLATLIRDSFSSIEEIRIYVITDRVSRIKNFVSKTINDKTVKLEVMDVERLYRHTVAGKPRDEIVVNLKELCGRSLQCVYVPKGDSDYSYALTTFTGSMIYSLYEKYSARLLEANVRSFLSFSKKINRDIRDTLINDPENFMACNNGLVVIADRMIVEHEENGNIAISCIKGMQIVNGGQTTSTIYFTKKKYSNTDLTKVFVQVKIICLEKEENKKLNIVDEEKEEELISKISRYANSQNSIRFSDLESNRSFHRTIESIFRSLYCPDGFGQWFYERAAGSYNMMLTLRGTTPARLRKLRQSIPVSRKITKTDLAKYYNSWNCKPEKVSLGAQKNFIDFMDNVNKLENYNGFKPDLKWVKECIAKAILFKNADRIVSSLKTSSKINVTTYLISVLSKVLKDNNITINFEKIWQNQGISDQLKKLLEEWAPEVYKSMLVRGKDMLLSEWAKKKECWIDVQKGNYNIPNSKVPEFNK